MSKENKIIEIIIEKNVRNKRMILHVENDVLLIVWKRLKTFLKNLMSIWNVGRSNEIVRLLIFHLMIEKDLIVRIDFERHLVLC